MNPEIERFLDECRAMPWFKEHPDLFENIEGLLAKIYSAGDVDPKYQELDDLIRDIVSQKGMPVETRLAEIGELVERVFGI